MKKIPAHYELTEEDIKAAIIYWLNNSSSEDGDGSDYEIVFSHTHNPNIYQSQIKDTISAIATDTLDL